MNATIHAPSSCKDHTHSSTAQHAARRLPESLAAIDGQIVIGDSGALRIVFSRKSLGSIDHVCFPVHWLIPLSDCELAAESAGLAGEILWLCNRPPQDLVGCLAAEVQGAWWDGPIITLRWNQGVETYSIPSAAHLEGSLILLAEVVSRRWVGQAPALVQQALNQASQRFPSPAPTHQPVRQLDSFQP